MPRTALLTLTALLWLAAALPARALPPTSSPHQGPRACAPSTLPEGVEKRWRGGWASGDGWSFGYVLHVTRRGDVLSGFFDWELRETPLSSMRGRVGDHAREYVRGHVDLASCTVRLTGYRLSDATLIGQDQYALTIAPDGALSGRTRGHILPYWTPRISGRPLR